MRTRCELYVNRELTWAKAVQLRIVRIPVASRNRRGNRFQRTIEVRQLKLDLLFPRLLGSGRPTASDELRTARNLTLLTGVRHAFR